jgi:hypothetical protein
MDMARFLYPIFVTKKTLKIGISSAILKRASKASLFTKITSPSLLLPQSLLLVIS